MSIGGREEDESVFLFCLAVHSYDVPHLQPVIAAGGLRQDPKAEDGI